MNIKRIFGNNLKILRTSLSLTQEQFAEQVELQPQSIAQIESGQTFVSSQTLEKICKKFKIQPETLFKSDMIVFPDYDSKIKCIASLLEEMDKNTVSFFLETIKLYKEKH